MAPKDDDTSDLASSTAKLTINAEMAKSTLVAPKAKASKKKKKHEVADSWEDEEVSSDDDALLSPVAASSQPAGTSAPPPTPSTPSYHSTAMHPSFGGNPGSSALSASWSARESGSSGAAPSRRPEKTDAVARRLIAGALGIRAPRQTDEQKAYDKSLREAERKRRDEEREAQKREQGEIEKAKKAIWED